MPSRVWMIARETSSSNDAHVMKRSVAVRTWIVVFSFAVIDDITRSRQRRFIESPILLGTNSATLR